MRKIHDDRRIHLIAAESKGLYFLRFVSSTRTEATDVQVTWSLIVEKAEELLRNQHSTSQMSE